MKLLFINNINKKLKHTKLADKVKIDKSITQINQLFGLKLPLKDFKSFFFAIYLFFK